MMQQTHPPDTTIVVTMGPDGRPVAAAATGRIARSVQTVWSVVTDVDKFPERVPMIHKVKKDGNRVTVDLKFKVSLLSVGFQFVVDAKQEEPRLLELAWVSGEPREMKLRYELTPIDADNCSITVFASFDAQSLGWLAKYFLKNHPEIENGIFPGVALTMVQSMRQAAESIPRG